MARLIMWNLMTLDGFVEGSEPRHLLAFRRLGRGTRATVDRAVAMPPAGLLFGRVTYELMANYWPNATGEVADFMNAPPKYVFSRTLTTIRLEQHADVRRRRARHRSPG